MPDLFAFPGRDVPRLGTGSGTWGLVSLDGQQKVQLKFQVIANRKDTLPYGAQLDISSGSLYYFLGDPDDGRRVSFEKKSKTERWNWF